MKKRAVNEIVTTVLITLIVLVLVAILWAYFKNFVLNSPEINTASFTSSFSLPPESVALDSLTQIVTFAVKRNAGEGNVIGFNVVLEDITGKSDVFRQNISIKELQVVQVTINFSGSNLGNLSKISIAPIFLSNSGKEIPGIITAYYQGVISNTFNSSGSGSGGAANNAPVVNAGSDINISTSIFPVSLLLNGSVTDDGLPNGTLIINWSKVSGPGGAILVNITPSVLNVSFNSSGIYVFRLTANDTNLTSIDDVTINVSTNSSGGSNSSIIFLSSCGVLNVTGGQYRITANLSTSYICFNVTANDIVLDGQQFTLTGVTTGSPNSDDTSILAYKVRNLTVKNVRTKYFTWGILIWETNNSVITSSVVDSAVEGGLSLIGGARSNKVINNIAYGNSHGALMWISVTDSDIINNTVYSNAGGVDALDSPGNRIINNTVYSNYVNGLQSSGPGGNNYSGNVVYGNPEGIRVINSQGNIFSNNSLNSNTLSIALHYTYVSNNNNLFTNIWINSSINDAIYSDSGNVLNNNFTNITVLNTNAAYNDLNFPSAGANGISFIDTFLAKYSLAGAGGVLNFKDSRYGEARYNSAISGSGSNLSSDIKILYDNVFLNSSKTGLNMSANITLYNLPNNISNPAIYNGLIVCSNCVNFTSLNAGLVRFRVPGAGNYTIR